MAWGICKVPIINEHLGLFCYEADILVKKQRTGSSSDHMILKDRFLPELQSRDGVSKCIILFLENILLLGDYPT